jgi:hypothetical protein
LLLSLILVAGCGGGREPVFAQTRLIIRMGGTIPPTACDQFADQHLTQLFPAGFTRIDGRQQWRHVDGTLTAAPCVVFEMIHLANADNAKRIDGAVLIAKRTFGADAVVMLQGHPDVRF